MSVFITSIFIEFGITETLNTYKALM